MRKLEKWDHLTWKFWVKWRKCTLTGREEVYVRLGRAEIRHFSSQWRKCASCVTKMCKRCASDENVTKMWRKCAETKMWRKCALWCDENVRVQWRKCASEENVTKMWRKCAETKMCRDENVTKMCRDENVTKMCTLVILSASDESEESEESDEMCRKCAENVTKMCRKCAENVTKMLG